MKKAAEKSDSRGATLRDMRESAARLIAQSGIAHFKVRDITDELAITPTLPLYYFGTTAGLLGAVAEDTFGELARHLREIRQSGPRSIKRLERVALAHGRFGLDKPLLYQAIHSSDLWSRGARSLSDSDAADKTNDWVRRAKAARNAAFSEYVEAVEDLQEIGALRKTSPAGRIAHLLSALVDGFLFQVREERVQASASKNQQLNYLASLVRLAIGGLRADVEQLDRA